MKVITITISKENIRKETPEERLQRVRTDNANRHIVFKNRKAYDRNKYKKFDHS